MSGPRLCNQCIYRAISPSQRNERVFVLDDVSFLSFVFCPCKMAETRSHCKQHISVEHYSNRRMKSLCLKLELANYRLVQNGDPSANPRAS